MMELDPHWEWHEIIRLGDPGPRYIRGACRHMEVTSVPSVTGETVAQLCLTCDMQLSPGDVE